MNQVKYPSIFAHVLYDHYNPPEGISVDKWYETFYGNDYTYQKNKRDITNLTKKLKTYAI